MRLYVGVIGAKQLLGPLDGQVLRHIHILAAAVVAPMGVSLGILVGQRAAHSGQHGFGHKVFGGNQLDVFLLPLAFLLNRLLNLRVHPKHIRYLPHPAALLKCMLL